MRPELKRNRQRGFTLMELLIAMVVTVFGLMGIMALHISLTQGTDTVNRTQEAVSIGAQVAESLRGQRGTDMAKTLTGSSTALPPYSVTNFMTKLGRNGVSYTVDVQVTAMGASSNLWKIRVVTNWTDDASNQTHALPIEMIRTAQEAL
jgi:prepilin-type N-terminal cleavage/methylation domain-containing protein